MRVEEARFLPGMSLVGGGGEGSLGVVSLEEEERMEREKGPAKHTHLVSSSGRSTIGTNK